MSTNHEGRTIGSETNIGSAESKTSDSDGESDSDATRPMSSVAGDLDEETDSDATIPMSLSEGHPATSEDLPRETEESQRPRAAEETAPSTHLRSGELIVRPNLVEMLDGHLRSLGFSSISLFMKDGGMSVLCASCRALMDCLPGSVNPHELSGEEKDKLLSLTEEAMSCLSNYKVPAMVELYKLWQPDSAQQTDFSVTLHRFCTLAQHGLPSPYQSLLHHMWGICMSVTKLSGLTDAKRMPKVWLASVLDSALMLLPKFDQIPLSLRGVVLETLFNLYEGPDGHDCSFQPPGLTTNLLEVVGTAMGSLPPQSRERFAVQCRHEHWRRHTLQNSEQYTR